MQRCEWVSDEPLYQQYHDEEWGLPCFDDSQLFEMLILEGAQAGLSWITVLKKRQAYRKAFDHFDAHKMARYSEKKIATLLLNPGIIRNRLKIRSAVNNAQAYLKVLEEFDCFADYIWQFVGGSPIINHWQSLADIPSQSRESAAMSKDLKKRGFSFVGATICYAYMQSTGMLNDHTVGCFRYKPCCTENTKPRR